MLRQAILIILLRDLQDVCQEVPNEVFEVLLILLPDLQDVCQKSPAKVCQVPLILLLRT